MAKRISIQSLVLIILCMCVNGVKAETTLVSYNFDADVLESGPDTYQIFRHKNSKAEISESYARTGYASAHLLDEPNDHDFVEFQGYFAEQKSGFINCHFSFLITNTNTIFHMALVGKDRYALSPLGLNFWLTYDNGWLKHKSDGIPKKIFQPSTYVWYTVDATLDLSKGLYNLRITDESGRVQTQLENQLFASGISASYSLQEFSFVGDLKDLASTDVYLDDFKISSSHTFLQTQLKAPGRKKYFVEMWDDYHKQLVGRLKCIAVKNIEDFGIYNDEYGRLVKNNKLDVLMKLAQLQDGIGNGIAIPDDPDLIAVTFWANACHALNEKDFSKAMAYINKAIAAKPNAYMYQLTELLIDSANDVDFYDLSARLDVLSHEKDDMRNQIAMAMMAFHAKKYSAADLAVGTTAFEDMDKFRKMPLVDLRQLLNTHSKWGAVEQYYFAALWQQSYAQAYTVAEDMLTIFKKANIASYVWLERRGDAAFFEGDYRNALAAYDEVIKANQNSDGVLLKTADIYHIQGDAIKERVIREKIYRNFSRR